MKISKVIEHCDKCQFAKRFNHANANIGCVFVCMKSARLIIHDKEVSHFSNIDPLDIPDWCELEEYTGDKNISFFDENGNEQNCAGEIHIFFGGNTASRDSLIERMFDDMEEITKNR